MVRVRVAVGVRGAIIYVVIFLDITNILWCRIFSLRCIISLLFIFFVRCCILAFVCIIVICCAICTLLSPVFCLLRLASGLGPHLQFKARVWLR